MRPGMHSSWDHGPADGSEGGRSGRPGALIKAKNATVDNHGEGAQATCEAVRRWLDLGA